MPMIYLFAAVIIAAVFYALYKSIGSPNKNEAKRKQTITEQIEAMGGRVVKIEMKKSSNYPYYNEIDLDDGAYHVYYQISYTINGEAKEGWAVLKLKQSLYSAVAATSEDWIWKL